MEEVWKDIPGYEGRYKVSNMGRIFSVLKNKFCKIDTHQKGYYTVTLSKNKHTTHKGIHYWVALAFIPNPEHKPEVHHIDKDKRNNCVENLMWVTRKEHAGLHPERYITISKKVKNGKRSKQIAQYTFDGQLVKIWPSAMEIQRQLGISNSNIIACCKGKLKQTHGFIWKYWEE